MKRPCREVTNNQPHLPHANQAGHLEMHASHKMSDNFLLKSERCFTLLQHIQKGDNLSEFVVIS